MSCHNFDSLPSPDGEDQEGYIPVVPMDRIRTVSDPVNKSIAILLEKDGLDCPMAITLDVHSTVQLIYALRLALRDVERRSIPLAPGW